ncbi:MAG: hypothetical protein M3421_13600 [Bacteroidota bacterium]|nr:hypothetical protein [Bacteroidota bacterium]
MKIIFLCILLTTTSCTYYNEEELLNIANCENEEISFAHQVAPLIQHNCAITSCHSNGSQNPELTSISSVSNNAMRIREKINNRTMPPPSSGKSLSAEEIAIITCWINMGTPNN